MHAWCAVWLDIQSPFSISGSFGDLVYPQSQFLRKVAKRVTPHLKFYPEF
jgi:hypothetical protein